MPSSTWHARGFVTDARIALKDAPAPLFHGATQLTELARRVLGVPARVQAVWARLGLPDDTAALARLVPADDLARCAAGPVRISLLGRAVEPLPR